MGLGFRVGIFILFFLKILLYSWLPTGTTYLKNMAIWNFFSLKHGKSGPFLPRKSCVI
jgi:hypothetical protein